MSGPDGTAPRRRRERKPQARSAVTRESILDAALECLVERGYARTAMADVAERAGVSRGALLHHFPTRAGLLAATIEHLAERRVGELRRMLEGRASDGDEIDAAVDFVWSAYTDPTAYAGLELVVAARTDDDLLESLGPVADRLDQSLRIGVRERARDPADRERLNALRNLIIVVMQGLAVMRIVKDEAAYVDGVLDLLKDLCRDLLATEDAPR